MSQDQSSSVVNGSSKLSTLVQVGKETMVDKLALHVVRKVRRSNPTLRGLKLDEETSEFLRNGVQELLARGGLKERDLNRLAAQLKTHLFPALGNGEIANESETQKSLEQSSRTPALPPAVGLPNKPNAHKASPLPLPDEPATTGGNAFLPSLAAGHTTQTLSPFHPSATAAVSTTTSVSGVIFNMPSINPAHMSEGLKAMIRERQEAKAARMERQMKQRAFLDEQVKLRRDIESQRREKAIQEEVEYVLRARQLEEEDIVRERKKKETAKLAIGDFLKQRDAVAERKQREASQRQEEEVQQLLLISQQRQVTEAQAILEKQVARQKVRDCLAFNLKLKEDRAKVRQAQLDAVLAERKAIDEAVGPTPVYRTSKRSKVVTQQLTQMANERDATLPLPDNASVASSSTLPLMPLTQKPPHQRWIKRSETPPIDPIEAAKIKAEEEREEQDRQRRREANKVLASGYVLQMQEKKLNKLREVENDAHERDRLRHYIAVADQKDLIDRERKRQEDMYWRNALEQQVRQRRAQRRGTPYVQLKIGQSVDEYC